MARTVLEEWTGFATAVLPKDAPPVQWREMRRSFYAGCWAMLQLAKELGGLAQTTLGEVEAEKALGLLEAELRRFQEDVARGRA